MPATTVQFYHLLATPIERALPRLLEKALAAGFKAVLITDSEERAEHFNQLLWTFDPGSFLPHGSMKDGNPEQQPVLVATPELLNDNIPPNQASLLVITNGITPPCPERFARILDIFDGNDPTSVEKARTRWSNYKNSGFTLNYLRQTQSGGWEQKSLA